MQSAFKNNDMKCRSKYPPRADKLHFCRASRALKNKRGPTHIYTGRNTTDIILGI